MGKNNINSELVWKYWALTVNKVADIINKFLPDSTLTVLDITNDDVFKLAEEAVESGLIEDMATYADNDPAAKKNYDYVYESCKGFEAIMYYRIAHVFITSTIFKSKGLIQEYLFILARRITEDAKVKTGIDINPTCQIGRGCVIDHGVGTCIGYENSYSENTNVFGETAIIGNNCTILNDVVIGAYEVNTGQRDGRRHPVIGDNVTICSGARILGAVIIGNNVLIGTNVIISQDIPSNCKVTLQSQYQIIKKASERCVQIYGIIEGELNGTLILGGENLDNVVLALIDATTYIYKVIEEPLKILSNNGKKVIFQLPQHNFNRTKNQKIMLRIITSDAIELYFYSEIFNNKL